MKQINYKRFEDESNATFKVFQATKQSTSNLPCNKTTQSEKVVRFSLKYFANLYKWLKLKKVKI